jgi:ubiquinone/menaquinone biosynthesis C-methylase UbiE
MKMHHEDLMSFNRIDETENPGDFIAFLDTASRNKGIIAMKRRTYELLDAKNGQRILEVGCGTGDDARQIVEKISPAGRLIAVDKSKAVIDEARSRSRWKNDSIEFIVGDATNLDLESAIFDACRIERTLIHIAEPATAMSEIVRVLRPGGILVAYEPDLEAYLLDSSYRELTRRILKFWYGQLQCGWVARHLPSLFKDSGFVNIKVEPRAMVYDFDMVAMSFHGTLERAIEAGVATVDEVSDWMADLERAHNDGTFLCANMGYIVSGSKP